MPAGILTVSLRSRADASGAAAGLARLGDRLAGAAAVRAGARDGEEALLVAQLPRAAALRAGFGLVPAAAPVPLQVSHVSSRGIWMVVSAALRRFLERNLEVVAQVGAALRPAAAPARRRRCRRTRRCRRARRRCPRSPRRSSGRSPRRPPRRRRPRGRSGRSRPRFSRVGEDRVGLGRLLEGLLGRLVARIAIRVVLQRELAIRALDLPVGRRRGSRRGFRSSRACSRRSPLGHLHHRRPEQPVAEHVAASEFLDDLAVAMSVGRLVQRPPGGSADRTSAPSASMGATPRLRSRSSELPVNQFHARAGSSRPLPCRRPP